MAPRVTVDYNYHGNPPFSWEVGQRPVQHAGNGDFVTGETGAWGFSALTVGLNAEFYRAATPGQPFQIAMQRGVRMYHDQTTRPLNDIRWELFTLLSHGGFVTMVDKTAFDGWLDPVAYERFGQAFKEVQAKRGQFGHQPVYEVGIYFSSRTRDWQGRENPAAFFQAFQGAHKALEYEHIPWGVLFDENIGPEKLRQFPVVLLPNVSILSEHEVSLFRRYVEEGGNLIITGQSGQLDHMGRPQTGFLLSELIGAKVKGRLDSSDNWITLPGQQDSSAMHKGKSVGLDAMLETFGGTRGSTWPFLVEGPAVSYEATTAKAYGELLKPHRTFLHADNRYNKDWPMSADSPVGPAILLNRVGKGAVLTVAASPDSATAGEHHLTETRKLLGKAVRLLNPAPRITIQAPINVQAVVSDNPATRTLRVHLMGYNTPPQTTPAKDRPYVLPVPIEDAPIYRVGLQLRDAVKGVKTFNPSTAVRRSGRKVELTVEDIHEVVILQY